MERRTGKIESSMRKVVAATAIVAGGLSLAACGSEVKPTRDVAPVTGTTDVITPTTQNASEVCKDELSKYPAEEHAVAYLNSDGTCAIAIPEQK